MQFQKRHGPLLLLTSFIVVLLGVIFFVEPIPQPSAYHHFADTRSFFGIPNFANVISNAGYALVGIWGVCALMQKDMRAWIGDEPVRWAFVLFFASIAAVSLGSGYYHFTPSNGSLFWDRLPMTIGFMTLFSLVVGDRVHAKLGKLLVWVLVSAGILSLVYWAWTQALGRGDLRFYALVQFYPIFAIPLICALTKEYRFTPMKYILWLFVWYAGAKVLELFDTEIFNLFGGIVSGHSIKHLFSAIAVLVVLRMLRFMQTQDRSGI